MLDGDVRHPADFEYFSTSAPHSDRHTGVLTSPLFRSICTTTTTASVVTERGLPRGMLGPRPLPPPCVPL
jgi:hypothetical protein